MQATKIGEQIRAQRRHLGMTQVQLCDQLNMRRATLVMIEQGKGNSLYHLAQVIDFLGGKLRAEWPETRVNTGS